ncbi:MAG: glycosyltransferase family 4 protein [Gemmatimonadales bacterium]
MPSGDSRLRILTVTHNYPRFVGDPAGAFAARLAEGVAARGHDVHVVAPHAPGLQTREQVGGVTLRRFRYAPEGMERVAYTGGLHQGTLRSPLAAMVFPGFLLAFEIAVRQAARTFRPHVVHAHWWFPGGWFTSHTGLPYVITCHGSDVRLLERGAPVRSVARKVLDRAARVTAVSRFLIQDIRRLLPDLKVEPVVTPMPLDVMRFQSGERQPKAVPPRILYAGNLLPSKGVDLLLAAAATLKGRGVQYELKILGEGPAQQSLRSQADRLGISNHIIWSSFVPQERMPQEYGASTVTVLPTRGRAEGLGLTLVEALLAGSSVVGTRAGGIPEVVHDGVTGLLAAEDPIDLANQLERMLNDQTLRARLTRAGRDHVLQTYSPEPAIERFLQLYHAAAHDRPHR